MSPIFVEGPGGVLIAAPPVTVPPPSAPPPPPAAAAPPQPVGLFEPGGPFFNPPPAPAPAAPLPSSPAAPIVGLFEPGGPFFNPPPQPQPAPAPAAPPIVGLFEPGGPLFNPPPQRPRFGAPPPPPAPAPAAPPIVGLFEPGGPFFNPPPLLPRFGAPPPPPEGLEDIGDRSSPLEPEDGPNLGDRELFARNPVLRGTAFVDYVRTRAEHYNLDPLAVFANYLAEGSKGVVGDDGHAYGPWQIWATDGRIRSFAKLGTFSDAVNTWTWSRDGVDYALRSMVAGGAAGLHGDAAVHAIVYGFERPANMRTAYLNRVDIYNALAGQGARVWAELANAAPGPVHTEPGLTGPGAGGAAGGPSVAHEPSAGDVHTAWADLMRVYGRTLPAATVNIRDARRELARSVT